MNSKVLCPDALHHREKEEEEEIETRRTMFKCEMIRIISDNYINIFGIMKAKILKHKYFLSSHCKALKDLRELNKKNKTNDQWDIYLLTKHLISHFSNHLNLSQNTNNNNSFRLSTYLNEVNSSDQKLTEITTWLANDFLRFLFLVMKKDNCWTHIDQVLIYDIIQTLHQQYPSPSKFRENEGLDTSLKDLYDISSSRLNPHRLEETIKVDVYSCPDVHEYNMLDNEIEFNPMHFYKDMYSNLPFNVARNYERTHNKSFNRGMMTVMMNMMKSKHLELEDQMKNEMSYLSGVFRNLSDSKYQLWDYFEYLRGEHKICGKYL